MVGLVHSHLCRNEVVAKEGARVVQATRIVAPLHLHPLTVHRQRDFLQEIVRWILDEDRAQLTIRIQPSGDLIMWRPGYGIRFRPRLKLR